MTPEGPDVYIYSAGNAVGQIATVLDFGIGWHRKIFYWKDESGGFAYTYSEYPSAGDYTVSPAYKIVEVGTGYIKIMPSETTGATVTLQRERIGDTFGGDLVTTYYTDTKATDILNITIPSKPQGISEIGYNIHQVFHSNPMNIGAITMSEYKSIARIDIALTSESRHDALTINKKYGRRKGNLVSYVRPQRPTRDCTFTIENDIYPVEILSMEVEIEY